MNGQSVIACTPGNEVVQLDECPLPGCDGYLLPPPPDEVVSTFLCDWCTATFLPDGRPGRYQRLRV